MTHNLVERERMMAVVRSSLRVRVVVWIRVGSGAVVVVVGDDGVVVEVVEYD